MKKQLLATLIAGFVVTSAFAQSPAAPTAKTTGDATTPMGDGTKADMKTTVPKAKAKHMRHAKKPAESAAK